MQRPSRMRPYDADVMRTTEPGRQLALNDSCRQKSALDDPVAQDTPQLDMGRIWFKRLLKILSADRTKNLIATLLQLTVLRHHRQSVSASTVGAECGSPSYNQHQAKRPHYASTQRATLASRASACRCQAGGAGLQSTS